jgi:hypothetical protein
MKKYLTLAGVFIGSLFFGGAIALAATVFIVPQGGTGWGKINSGTVVLGNNTGAVATTSAATNGQILGFLNSLWGPISTSSVSIGGNAGTATALAANGTNCSAGNYPLGIDASGNVENCTAAGTGTVTAVSVASANGFAGSSSGGATPALTLTTTITGLLKGNGTAISAAALTDFPTQAAGTVIANGTGSTAAPTAIATSTLYGAVQNGKVLAGLGGVLAYVATSTDSCSSGVTCSYSGGTNSFSIAAGAITNTMLASTYVTSLTVNTAQGVSGSFSAGATPALSLTLGALTGVTSFNGLVVTANTGVITTGTWNGTTIAVANGGTNATSFNSSMLVGSDNAGTTIVATSTPQVAAVHATSTTAASYFNYNVGIASTSPVASLGVATGTILVAEFKPAATSTSQTVNWLNGTQQLLKIGTAGVTVSFVGASVGQTLRLVTCAPDSGTMGTITWPAGIRWAGGTAPTQTTTAQHCDTYSFLGTQATSTTASALFYFGAQSANF